MIKLLKCELIKIRRCYIFLTALLISVFCIVWGLRGDYSKVLHLGWNMLLYQLPLLNSIFLPFIATITASRLAGIEHKGNTLKQLFTMTEPRKLYDIKFVMGLTVISISIIFMWSATIIYGKYTGFTGEFPFKLYLMYLVFTFVPTISVYVFQYIMSMLFKNQAIGFFIGIAGQFMGLFSMFLPNVPLLRKIIPWGYYGVLQLVGLYGWTKETRFEYAYYELMPIDWLAFFGIIAVTVIMYFVGRNLFSKKEV